MIWFGFTLVYQVVRGFADRNPARAFANGFTVLTLEQRTTHHVSRADPRSASPTVATGSRTAASWTYWNSEFTVIGLALLWVYLRRHEHFSASATRSCSRTCSG